MQCYFFRDCVNYEELENKTDNAFKRDSKNLREVKIAKKVEIEERHEDFVFNHFLEPNKYIIANLEDMKIEKGIWYCIELYCKDNKRKSMLVMSNGYPYAKFTAIVQQREDDTR